MTDQPLNSHVQPVMALLQGLLRLCLAETHALQIQGQNLVVICSVF